MRNRYNQVLHLAQDTDWKVTTSQLDTTNESQEVSPFPAGDHKASINRCAQSITKDRNNTFTQSTHLPKLGIKPLSDRVSYCNLNTYSTVIVLQSKCVRFP